MDENKDTELVDRNLETWILKEYAYPTLLSSVQKLDGFLEENRHIFTLIGVFGAISVYLKTVGNETSTNLRWFGDFALVAGLTIVVILSLVVLINLFLAVKNAVQWYAIENWGLFLFTIFFIPLMFVVVGVASQFPTIWAGYYIGGIYLVSFTISLVSLGFLILMFKYIRKLLDIDYPIPDFLGFLLIEVTGIYLLGTNSIVDVQILNNLLEISTFSEWISLFVIFAVMITASFSLFLSTIFLFITVVLLLANLVGRTWKYIQ